MNESPPEYSISSVQPQQLSTTSTPIITDFIVLYNEQYYIVPFEFASNVRANGRVVKLTRFNTVENIGSEAEYVSIPVYEGDRICSYGKYIVIVRKDSGAPEQIPYTLTKRVVASILFNITDWSKPRLKLYTDGECIETKTSTIVKSGQAQHPNVEWARIGKNPFTDEVLYRFENWKAGYPMNYNKIELFDPTIHKLVDDGMGGHSLRLK
jgi:hypothetical protein